MNTHVLLSIFKRNFVSYFSNPTGYLFICVFVLMCAIAAFWSPDFFNNNLANLDQLSWGFEILGVRFGFPFIMLVFIPSITMGIWADERRQGTDELLLTIPAGDSDIVLGKYLAATAIYSAALLFSMVCNFIVLENLGNPDIGLFLGTYFGYWLIGVAMLAVGMVASFLTANLTVSYILGAMFNAPLVFASAVDSLSISGFSISFKPIGIGAQLAVFSRGVVSFSSILYFAAITAAMLYVSMVLIARRHWQVGEQSRQMGAHYAVRFLALGLCGTALMSAFKNHDVRWDVTSEKINSVTPQTKELLTTMKFDRPVQIEAFISPKVPDSYIQTRLNLISMLEEIQATAGRGNVQVVVHDTEPSSDASSLAETKYGIEPKKVYIKERGIDKIEEIFMHLVVSSGLETIPPVFIDRGIPIEYELIRSLGTVTQQKTGRKTIGVLRTDVPLMGSAGMMGSSPKMPIITELEKQYDVVEVNPVQPIMKKYDVLLAVQPSTLGPNEMNNFIAAVQNGQPTAVFEDPFPYFFMPQVAATSQPRRAPGGMEMMMMGQRNPPKGDITALWRLLGVDFPVDEIVWQDYNPYPKSSMFPKEFVIVDEGEYADKTAGSEGDKEKRSAAGKNPFASDNPITAGLQQVLFPFPGAISKLNASSMEFVPLIRTGQRTGALNFNELLETNAMGQQRLKETARRIPTFIEYVMAAEIRGKVKVYSTAEDKKTDAGDEKTEGDAEKKAADAKAEPKMVEKDVCVVLIPDIDMLIPDFFALRERGSDPEKDLSFDFDNVTLLLNVLDILAKDERFVEIRKHRPAHRTLTRIEAETAAAKTEATEAIEEFMRDYEQNEKKLRKAIDDKIAEVQKRKNTDIGQMAMEVAIATQQEQKVMEQQLKQDKTKMDKKKKEAERNKDRKINEIKDQHKLWAVLLPPIPPLLIGIFVFLRRRSQESEGVARSRMK